MFSTTSEYALRALVHLAREPEGSWLLGQDLAARANIPSNYLSKILWTLGNAGLLEATRGHGGGYRLARPADQITLLEVVRQFEGVYAEPGCLLGEQHECSDKNPCSAHAAWKKVKEAYVSFIRDTTIAEIGKPAKPRAQRGSTKSRMGRRKTIAKRR
jgi:Rrf2 family protein